MKSKRRIQYDRLTEQISRLLGSVPRVGKYLVNVYLWKPGMFNYMLVGASGTVLSYLLYEGLFRVLLSPMWGGTFLGMVIVTVLVFLWNFFWNKKWSLKPSAQIIGMKRSDLLELKGNIENLLSNKFDHNGDRV